MATVAGYMTAPQIKQSSSQAQQMNPAAQTPGQQYGSSGSSQNLFGSQPNNRTIQVSSSPSTWENIAGQQTTPSTTYSTQPVRPASQRAPNDQMVTTQAMTTATGLPSWNLPQWSPQIEPVQGRNAPAGDPFPRANPAGRGGIEQLFFGSDPNLFNPEAFKDNDAMTPNYISSVLPVAQFGQNAYQWRSEFDEAARRWDIEMGNTMTNDALQRELSIRQQMSAEEQARLAAEQWNQQFGHTTQLDWAGIDLSRQQIANQYSLGMDQNAATRDVARMYSEAQRYGAELGLQGTRYASDQERIAAMYAADIGLQQAGLYSGAQRYGAELGLQGQKYAADIGLQQAGLYSGAQRYGAELGLQGQKYAADIGLQQAGLYSGAQRYGAELGLQGVRYQSDTERAMAEMQNRYLYTQLAQQAQQAELERQNAMQLAAMAAYGRSQAPTANWARNWG